MAVATWRLLSPNVNTMVETAVQMGSFGDGQCNGGVFNTEGWWYDYEDRKVFNDLCSDCSNELLMKSTVNVTLGNRIREGGGYNVEECGFEFGDWGKAQIGQDILLNGVLSPSSNIIDLNMMMSSDGSTVLVDMFRTDCWKVWQNVKIEQ